VAEDSGGRLRKQFAEDELNSASEQEAIDRLLSRTGNASAASRAAVKRLFGDIDAYLNSSSLIFRNLTTSVVQVNATSSAQIQTSLAGLQAKSTILAQNVSDAIMAIVEQYTATVSGVTAQLKDIAGKSVSNGSLSVNASSAKFVLDSLSRLIDTQRVLEKTLGDLITSDAADRSRNLTSQVLDPSKLLVSAVASILTDSVSNRTALAGLIRDITSLSESTMSSTWKAVQQAQSLTQSQLEQSRSGAQFDIFSQSNSNQQNSYLAQSSFGAASGAVSTQSQNLAGARYAAANSAKEVMFQVDASRANITAMLGSALTQMGETDSDTASQVLATQSTSDPAAVMKTVANILSTWEAFSATALSQADQSATSAASVVTGQQLHANQLAHSVGRKIFMDLATGVESVSSLTGLVNDLTKFSNLTSETLPDTVNTISKQMIQSRLAFENQLTLDLANLTALAKVAADQEVADATEGLDHLVKSTMDKLAHLQGHSPLHF